MILRRKFHHSSNLIATAALAAMACAKVDEAAKPAASSEATATTATPAAKAAPTPTTPTTNETRTDLSGALEGFTVAAPANATVSASGKYATVTTPSYAIDFALLGPKDGDMATVRSMYKNLKLDKYIVDTEDGVVADVKDKGKTGFKIHRFATIDGKKIACQIAKNGTASTAEIAKEAFQVCGTLKKK